MATKRILTRHLSLRLCVFVISPGLITLTLIRVLVYWNSTWLVDNWGSTLMDKEITIKLRRNDILCRGISNKSNVCHNVLFQMRQAKWQRCKNVTTEDEHEQNEVELHIRQRRGLPVVLHRNDFRCGKKPFLLNSENFGFDLPALCDATSSAPCCQHKTGRCGLGKSYCSCKSCTDFRREISAELHDWVPLSGCTFLNFTSQSACDLMSKKILNLILIGDSLVRHLYNALMIVFTDDIETGSLQRNLPENERKSCKSLMQFVDGGKTSCNAKTLNDIPHEDGSSFCRGRYNFSFSLKEYYSLSDAQSILHEVRKHLNNKATLIAIGIGLHSSLNSGMIKAQIIEPVLQMKRNTATNWPHILWLSIHAHGSLKDSQYNIPSHNERIIRFNKEMEGYLEERGISVFDTFNLTQGVRSIDGTHFGIGVNMMKAQLFLNFIHKTL